jgi:hypothetical protein
MIDVIIMSSGIIINIMRNRMSMRSNVDIGPNITSSLMNPAISEKESSPRMVAYKKRMIRASHKILYGLASFG